MLWPHLMGKFTHGLTSPRPRTRDIFRVFLCICFKALILSIAYVSDIVVHNVISMIERIQSA